MLARALLLSSALSLAIGCRTSSGSSVKIDDGISVEEGESIIPGVVAFNGCTATAISPRVLITAAHCLTGADPTEMVSGAAVRKGKVCAKDWNHVEACTEEVYVPTQWLQSATSKKFRYDVAVAVYSSDIFSYYHTLSPAVAAIDDSVLLVGRSPEKPKAGHSTKRWGRNKVSDFEYASDSEAGAVDQGPIVTKSGSSAEFVAISSGDSGGPMFDAQCRLIGVASRMVLSAPKKSLHTKVGDAELKAFWSELRGTVNVAFCGDGGDICAPSRTVVATVPANVKTFPCAASAEATDPDIPMRLEEIRAKYREIQEQLATTWFHCDDTGGLASRPGKCYRSNFRSFDNGAVQGQCDARALHYDGKVVKAQQAEGNQFVVEIPTAPIQELDSAIACSAKAADFEGCCVEQKCFGVVDGGVSENTLQCEGLYNPLEFKLVAPHPEKLRQESFSCSDAYALELRQAGGLCVDSQYRQFANGDYAQACSAEWLLPDGRVYENEGEPQPGVISVAEPSIFCMDKPNTFEGCCVVNACREVVQAQVAGFVACGEEERGFLPFPNRIIWGGDAH